MRAVAYAHIRHDIGTLRTILQALFCLKRALYASNTLSYILRSKLHHFADLSTPSRRQTPRDQILRPIAE
jgi:hypothetical protein